MPEHSSNQINSLLQQWAQGDEQALAELIPVVYGELRRQAHYQLKSERSNHTLQSTALVNEALVRLLGSEPIALKNRAHFVGVAARLMRQILVDYARTRRAGKRDWGDRIEVEAIAGLPVKSDVQLLALDDALESLSQLHERQARIVEMKFFGGLKATEISAVLGISIATVERDWMVARLWLRRQMDAMPAQ